MIRTLVLSACMHVFLFSAALMLSTGLIKGSLDMSDLAVLMVSLEGQSVISEAAAEKEPEPAEQNARRSLTKAPLPAARDHEQNREVEKLLPEPVQGAFAAPVREKRDAVVDRESMDTAHFSESASDENRSGKLMFRAAAVSDRAEAGARDRAGDDNPVIPAGAGYRTGFPISRAAEGAGGSSGNSSLSLSPSTLAIIGRALDRAKTYPLIARKRGLEGTVYVSFLINPDGRPRNIEVLRSSGFAILDRATVHLVKRAAPYPRVESRVEVPVAYQLGP